MARPIVMPSLGMYTSEGTVTDWLHSPGDRVEAGEQVVEITTEKATYQIEAPEAGVLHAVVEIGTSLPVQALIGYILAPGEDPPATPTGPAPAPPAARGSGAPSPPGRLAAQVGVSSRQTCKQRSMPRPPRRRWISRRADREFGSECR